MYIHPGSQWYIPILSGTYIQLTRDDQSGKVVRIPVALGFCTVCAVGAQWSVPVQRPVYTE